MPAKLSPISPGNSRSWRSAAIWKAARLSVIAPHRVRFCPAQRQPVSSTQMTGESLTASRSPAYGSARAPEVRWQIASTEPAETSQPNSSPQSSEASRREIRLRTESNETAACNLGPKALWRISSGNDARVLVPQPGQRSE